MDKDDDELLFLEGYGAETITRRMAGRLLQMRRSRSRTSRSEIEVELIPLYERVFILFDLLSMRMQKYLARLIKFKRYKRVCILLAQQFGVELPGRV